MPQPFSLGKRWCQRSALCILAPLPTPEVTIPEQKLSKGKGAKTGSKEKRSILMESEVGWEKWGGALVPGVQAPSPSRDGASSPVLWQQPLRPACFLSQPGLAGGQSSVPPPLLLGAPLLILASTQSASQNAIRSSPPHPRLVQLQREESTFFGPASSSPGRQAVLLAVVLPSPCAQHLETLSPLPLQPPFSLSTWTNLSLALKTFLGC